MTDQEIQAQIDLTVKDNKIVIFMKGSPMQPACGFSAKTTEILRSLGQPFSYVDIFEIPGVREGIKQYTNWPTIPQVFVNGEFVGGCDIVTEMHETGELQKMVGEAPAADAPTE